MIDELGVHALTTQTGKDWELITQAGILLGMLDAKLSGKDGPFGIAKDAPFGRLEAVERVTMPPECCLLDSASAFIDDHLRALKKPTIVLFSPSYGAFPDFDGFVAYSDGGARRRVYGYQCKEGDAAMSNRRVPG